MKLYFNLKLKSVNKNSLFIYTLFLKKLFIKLDINFCLIMLPKKRKLLTLLKSPHVYKKAREQFQLITFVSCFFFYSNLNPNFIKFFILNKPKTVKLILRKL